MEMNKSVRSSQSSEMTSSLPRIFGLKSSPVPCPSSLVVCPKVHSCPRLSSPTCGPSRQITTRTSTLRQLSSSISSKRKCSRCSKLSCSSRCRVAIQARVVALHQLLQTHRTVACQMLPVKMVRHHRENLVHFQLSQRTLVPKPTV